MADFATLDAIGFDKEFYYRDEIEQYRGKGYSDEELEEEAANILLDVWLTWDRTKYSQKQFCCHCKKALRALIRRSGVRRKTSSIDEHEDNELASPLPEISDSIMSMVDVGFMETWSYIFNDIFEDSAKKRVIAQKHLLEGKTFQMIADEMGCKSRQGIQQQMPSILYSIKSWVLHNVDKLYSYFEPPVVEAIIDLAQAC